MPYASFSHEDRSASPVLDSRSGRVKTRLRVAYGVHEPEFVGYADNVSKSGLYINTNRVFKNGTRLNLEVEFPQRAVRLVGEVVWAIRVPEHERSSMVCGMGVQFVAPGAWWTPFFREWIRSFVGSAGTAL
jgi:uncharacterized protein (TIGR02266 family)